VRNVAAFAGEIARGRFDLVHSFSRVAYLLPILPLSIPKLMTYQRPIARRSVVLGHAISRGSLWFSAISDWMMRHVRDCGTWRLVFNGVPLETYDYRADPGPDAPLVFLGRVEGIKGPHLAIDVARRTGKRLIVAGNVPSEHRAWFDKEIAPRVDGRQIQYIGPVDDAQKNLLLGSAGALLMPIVWDEPFGIVMAEAMACGTPVIGTRRGAVPEVVQHGVTGFVETSLEGMVSAVRRIDEIDRRACRRRVENLFSDAAVVDAYLEVYLEMLGSPSGRARDLTVF
jgi:glycosyltransferase involved in cell wall biosynthesis